MSSPYGNTPYRSGSTTATSVGEPTGCSNTVGSVAVAMYHKRWLGDGRMVTAKRSNVKGVSITVAGKPQSGWDIYTMTNSSSGGSSQSSNYRR